MAERRTKEKGRESPAPGSVRYCGSGDLGGRTFLGVAKHIAASPDGFDVIVAVAGAGELLAKLADKDVDNLQFRLVHAAIKVVEEHFLGERGALANRKHVQHGIFLAGQLNASALPRSEERGVGKECDS